MTDDIVQRIQRFRFPRGAVIPEHRNRGYTLYHALSGAPVARLRPTGHNESVEVLYWSAWKERWAAAGPFRRTILPIDEALDFIAHEHIFWVLCRTFRPTENEESRDEDGAKTRELIREHLDVDQIKREFPTYVLDENYLTKIDDLDPDAKALDIEAMLAAELKIRVDQDPQAEPLSEKLKRIIDAKRNGALHGVALISALEQLAAEVVDLVNEGKKPVSESIAHAARETNPGITVEQAAAIAAAVVEEAKKVCFPNWFLKSDVKGDLFLVITTVLVQQFKYANLHIPATGFVERAIRLLEKTRFVGYAEEGASA